MKKPSEWRVLFHTEGAGYGIAFVKGETETQAREAFQKDHPRSTITELILIEPQRDPPKNVKGFFR